MKKMLTAMVLTIILSSGTAIGKYCWNHTAGNATNPQPWAEVFHSNCGTTNSLHSPGSTTGQTIGHEHRNWHCTNDEASTEAYGRAFLAFHRQFIQDFDILRLGIGIDRLEIWDPFENAPIPGNQEDLSVGFTWCSTGNVRPAGAICTNCVDLPDTFKVGLGLEDFPTLGEVGNELELGTFWHGTYHNGVSDLNGDGSATGITNANECWDIAGFINTSRDPAFWMAHKKLDEVARDWQSLKATDVVIVMDRSGSMDDNCVSIPPPPGTDCAIEDARQAARMFADAVLDVRLNGGSPASEQHRIGLVSFANTATPEVELVPANGIVANNGTPFNVALNSISAGGGTSIAAGIREAISVLNAVPTPNPHQAILVLTDGKENVAPCLGGNSPSSCSSSDQLTAAEIGNIQVVAVGFGPGATEANLRDVSERHGGVFFAQDDISASLDLQKFFITASGEIFDAPISLDPKGRIAPGQQAAEEFDIPVCGDERLSVVLGYKNPAPRKCDLELELFTPSGKQVDRSSSLVEAGHGDRHDFMHVTLPYNKEASGTWKGRIVRSPQSSQSCGAQEYFYSVLAKGIGRVAPFVSRPRLFVGRSILAAFRISESNRPKGGFDSVKAEVTLTQPNGETVTSPLFDDGTNGDKLPGNHIWSVELPAVKEPGPYHVRGRFILEKNGCSKIRESEYSIVAEREAEQPTSIKCGGTIRVRPGDKRRLDGLACLWNQSAIPASYKVEVKDSRGWVQTPRSFDTGRVAAFERLCFGRGRQSEEKAEGGPPLGVVVPQTAREGEESIVTLTVDPIKSQKKGLSCKVAIQVVPPPDCNENGTDDALDISNGKSKDMNADGIPDECQGRTQYQLGDILRKFKLKR